MSTYQNFVSQLPLIEERLGYVFQDKTHLIQAFVHRSFFNEHKKEVTASNERMEFLGDSILGLLIAEFLYARLPEEEEGTLSHLRANFVEAGMCAQFVKKLLVEEFVLLGRGELINKGGSKGSIQADLFEALLAAIYLDGGMEAAKTFFWSHFKEEAEACLNTPMRNWKAELQDYFQKMRQKPPTYRVLQEVGPDHNKQFSVGVFFEAEMLGQGTGSSKKEGEQAAAQEALLRLQGEKNG